MLPLFSLTLPRSPSLHACVEEKGRGGGEDKRMWLCASLFAPYVWELLLVCFCLCFSRVDISFVPSSLCCYSVNPLEAEVLLQPHHLQTGSKEGRHHVEGGANLSGAWGKIGTHVSIHPSEHTLNKSPCCKTNKLLTLLNKAVPLTWLCIHCEVDLLSQPAYSMR